MRIAIIGRAFTAMLALSLPAAAKNDTFVYVNDGGALHGFRLDTKTGTLEELPGSPFAGLESSFPLDGWCMTLEAGKLGKDTLLFSGGNTGATMWSIADDGVPSPEMATGITFPPGALCTGTATLAIGKQLFVYTSQTDDASVPVVPSVQGFEFFTKGGNGFFTGPLMNGPTGDFPVGLDAVKNKLVVAGASGTLSSFLVNKDGELTPAPGSPFASPTDFSYNCQLEPSAKRVYVADGNARVHVLSVDDQGVLATIPGSPFDTGLSGGNGGVEVLKKPFVLAFDLEANPGDPLVSVMKRGSGGKLTLVGEPQVVPGMASIDVHAVDGKAKWLVVASDDDDLIEVLPLDLGHGTLTEADSLDVTFTEITGMAIVQP